VEIGGVGAGGGADGEWVRGGGDGGEGCGFLVGVG